MKQLLAALLVAVVAAAPAWAQCSDADRRVLEEFDKTWGEATERGDRAALTRIYADDYAGVSLTGTQSRTEAIDAAMQQYEQMRANPDAVPSIEYDLYVIACTPASATVTHRNIIRTQVDGREQTAFSRSVHILEKRGGQWQVVSNAGHPLTDQQVLFLMQQEWNDAAKKRDFAWFENNFADDGISIQSTTGKIQTKKAMLDEARASTVRYDSLALSDLNIRVDGSMAVVTGVNHVIGRDDKGQPFDRRVAFTDTFVKRDGRWLVLTSQGTPVTTQVATAP